METRSEKFRRAYQDAAVARSYDEDRSRHPSQRMRARLERAMIRRAFGEVPRPGTILDVACGTGRLAPLIASRCDSLTGVDVSPAMLAVAHARGLANTRWVAGDATRLPFADASFDLVVSHRFVRHLHACERAAVFHELRRVTRRWVVVELLVGGGLVSRWKRLLHDRSWSEEMQKRRPCHATATTELAACGLSVVSRRAIIPWVSEPHLYVCERMP